MSRWLLLVRRPLVFGLAVAGCGGLATTNASTDSGASGADATTDSGPVATRDGGDSSVTADSSEPLDGTMTDGQAEAEASDSNTVDSAVQDSPADAISEAEASCSFNANADGSAPITVSGQVVFGTDIPNTVNVTIQGQTTTSGTDGSFTIGGVIPPYDVLLDPSGTGNHLAYVGLTRSDPTLICDVGGMGNDHYGRLSGTLSGDLGDAGAILGALLDTTTLEGGSIYGLIGASLSIPTFDVSANWAQGATAPATLWGLSATKLPSGGVEAITALGSMPVTLQSGVHLTGVDLPLSPTGASAATLSGSVTLPLGYSFSSVSISLGRGRYGGGLVAQDSLSPGATSFSYGTFTSTLTWSLQATAGRFPLSGVFSTVYLVGLAGNETLQIDFPDCTTNYLTPANGAVLPAGACVDIEWTESPSSAYELTMFGPGNSLYKIISDKGSIRVPYSLPSGQYSWVVRQIAPAGSLDTLTGSFDTAVILNGPGFDILVNHVECSSSSASAFTLQ